MLTEMIVGRTIAECRERTVEDLIDALHGVPPDKLHCPVPAIRALRDALATWTTDRGERKQDSNGDVQVSRWRGRKICRTETGTQLVSDGNRDAACIVAAP